MSAGALPVLLAAPGLAMEPDLVARLGRPGSPVTVVRRCVDAVDVVGACAAGTARAAVISAALPRLSRETVARAREAGVTVYGIAAEGDTSAAHLSALGVSVVRVPGEDPDAATESLIRVLLGADSSQERETVASP